MIVYQLLLYKRNHRQIHTYYIYNDNDNDKTNDDNNNNTTNNNMNHSCNDTVM